MSEPGAAGQGTLTRMAAGLLETAANRVLAMDEDARQRLSRLQDRCLALHLRGPEVTLYISADEQRLLVRSETDAEADTTISGSPAALFSMAAPEWSRTRSGVEIVGNTQLARELEQIFKNLDPDWEEPLTGLFGDVLGHQLASGLRRGASLARDAASSTAAMLRDYLQEESRVSVHPREMKQFLDEVDQLREDSDRLAAKVERLHQQHEGDES